MLLCVIAAAGAGAARGEPAALDLERLAAPSFDSFGARDGLPDGVITAIGVDRDGFAWASSTHGLFRFVGHRWQHRLSSDYGKTRRRMTLTSDGTFWAPTADAGLVALRDGHWQNLQQAGGVPIDSIYRIDETRDDEGRLRTWMLGWNGGLFERRDGQWLADPGSDSLPQELLLSIERTDSLFGETRYWIGTGNSGVWFRREGETDWQPFRVEGLQGGQVEDIQRSVDARGEALWLAVFGHGLWRIDRDGMRTWRAERGELRSNQLYTIAVEDAPQGEAVAWVASRSGLLRVRGASVDTFDRRHGLPSDRIRATALWRSPQGEQLLWIATEAGVARAVLSAERWRTVSLAGADSIGVFGVLVEDDGHGVEQLWLTSYGDGLGLYREGRWQHFGTHDGSLPHDSGRLIARAVDLQGHNALWLGLDSGQLIRVDEGPSFSEVAVPWPMVPGNAPMAVLSRRQAGQPELWFATRLSGLYRWRKDGWRQFQAVGLETELRAHALVEQIDAQGQSWLWVSSAQGLARFDGERLELLRDIAGLPRRVLLGLGLRREADGRQTLWIGSQFDGLIRLDVSDPREPRLRAASELPPPIYSMVYSALHDSQQRIYLCTNDGVQQLVPRAAGGWDETVFRRSDGMVHEECNSGAQFIDRLDRYWTGTLGGLTVFDPHQRSAARAKRLKLVGSSIDNQEVDAGQLVMRPAARELRLEFSLQSWQREAETRYRTQLLGFDPQPGDWSPQPLRNLGALPPGEYRLRIEARDFAGLHAEPLELPIEVLPAWWQHRGTQAAALLATMLLTGGLAHWRTRSLRAQKRQLEAEVGLRTAALNQANARLLQLSYTDALTGIANRRMLLERLDLMLAELDGGTQACALIFIDVDRFKDFNDRFGHPAGDQALRAVASTLTACAPEDAQVARFGGEEFACLLPDRTLPQAIELAQSMRIAVHSHDIQLPGQAQPARLSISLGVSALRLQRESDISRLLREADAALYRAKSSGRNCVRT